jgi:phosphatidylethanolamine/phosphatidyl-N-methylethanolamine N-methyltransferase
MSHMLPVSHAEPALGRFFLRKFLRDPKDVASIWPSSRWLARAMLRGVEVPPRHAVVELGPGTGAFTAPIVEMLARTPGGSYLGIERDAEFCALLRRRFPDREFVWACASTLAAQLAARPDLRLAAVISGLPLVAMPKPMVAELVRAAHAALAPGGWFCTFSYQHSMLNPAQWWLRRLLRSTFGRLEVRPVLRNVPPALAFAARK